MKNILFIFLLLPLSAIANMKDTVMEYMRNSAEYQVKVTDWYKKNDTWITELTTRRNEKMKVTISGDRVAVHSYFSKPISDMSLSGCASVSKEVIPEASYWDENATANTKAVNQLWSDKGWQEKFQTKTVIIDGWKIIAIKKSLELSCVIEPVSV
ncbi:hypothetical protein [Photorhabdus luminescens]|uniref:Uncharacterized protein n=1 Tax=Photorhabdus luminescens subsp. mexicana TaxID=2100167 RepID=A0A4R4IM58_PHOLU|nr:hypothetical protein [Photorhabdus luminescens]TDB41618.1 hypothetical protein C5468_25650 [Photorhabdus luminescens subsp. mexicana]